MSQALLEQWKREDENALGGLGETQGPGVRAALIAASGTTADQEARNMELAGSLGFTPEVIAEQRDWAEQEEKARTIEANPLFAKWAEQDKKNTAFARDDTQAMGDVFEIMMNAERSAYGEGQEITDGMVRSILEYEAKHGDKEARQRLAGMGAAEPSAPSQLAASFGEGVMQVGKSLMGALALVGENMQANVEDEQGASVPLATNDMFAFLAKSARARAKEIDDWNATALNAKGFLNDIARNLPQVLSTGAVTALTGGAAGLAFMGAQIGGGEYLDLTAPRPVNLPSAAEIDREVAQAMKARGGAQGEGALALGPEWNETLIRGRIIAEHVLNTPSSVAPGVAAAASVANAAVQAPLEMIGLSKIANIFKTTGLWSMVKGVFESAATEFITETIQQHPDDFSRIWAEGVQSGATWGDIWQKYASEFWNITKEGMYSGLVAAPLGVLGGLGKVASDASMAKQAMDWAIGQRAFHAKVEETKAKQTAPSVLQSALEAGGMTGTVDLPATEVLRLHQDGVPILDAMGWEEQDVQVEAERGGDMTAKLARLHSHLDTASFERVIPLARPSANAWTLNEAEQFDARVKEDVDRIVKEKAVDDTERSAIEVERERIKEEFRQAMQSIPGLRAEIKGTDSLSDLDMRNRDSIEAAVAYNMAVLDSLAATFSRYESPLDFYSRISTRGMMFHPENGRLVTPAEYLVAAQNIEEREWERANEEALRPFWERVWHRIDPASLKADWPEAERELRSMGLGLIFQPASRGGIAIDEIADELERAHILTEGGGADALIEKLKGMKAPRRGWRGRRLNQFLGEQGAANLDRAEEASTRMDNLAVAREMETAGKDAKAIKLATGWERGADGKWRYEVPEGRVVTSAKLERKTAHDDDDFVYYIVRLGDIYDEPELYAAYPELKDMQVVFQPMERGNRGMYDGERLILSDNVTAERWGRNDARIAEIEQTPEYQKYQQELDATDNIEDPIKAEQEFDRISAEWDSSELGAEYNNLLNTNREEVVSLGKLKEEALPTLLHEIQHAIQEREGFAIGGSSANPDYHRLGGEVESRNVQKRMNMTPEERRASLASETEDVAREDQIFLWDGLGAAMEAEGENNINGVRFKQVGRKPSREDFVLLPDGSKDFGALPEIVLDNGRRLKAGPIRLQRGISYLGGGYGYQHIEDVHGNEIRAAGYPNVQSFVWDLVHNFNQIWNEPNGTLRFVKDFRSGRSAGFIRLERKGDFYEVRSAFPMDTSLFLRRSKKDLLWTGDPHQSTATEEQNPFFTKPEKLTPTARTSSEGSLRSQRGQSNEGTIANTSKKGNRLFQTAYQTPAERQARGYVEIAKGHEYTIQLLQHANLSTLLHETGHIALSEMERLIEMGVADARLIEDYQKIREYLGLQEGDNLADGANPRMIEANEKFAKAWELYLREGKAPSAKLESAFSRFKRWLLRIYKSVVNNPYFKGVELNEDIRGVFDRLLATDDEIRRAAEKNGLSDDLKAELDSLGLSGNERAQITSLIQEAQEQAADNLQKARDAGRLAKLNEWRKKAHAIIETELEYRALKLLRANGIDADAVVQLVGEDMKNRLMKRLPGVKSREGGASPEAIAWEAGFSTPEEMIQAVVKYPKALDRVRELVDAMQEEHDVKFHAEDYLYDTDALAASEEQLAQAIDKIMRKARYQGELAGRTVDGVTVEPTEEEYLDYGPDAQRVASRETIKRHAEESLQKTHNRDALSPWRFRAAVRRYVNEERRALMRQDWAAAQKANYQLRLNMELARQAEQLRQNMEKFQAKLKQFLKNPQNDPNARYAVAALAVPLGLTPMNDMIERTAAGRNFDSVKAWVHAVQDESFPISLNERLFVDGSPVLWRDMTVEQFDEWFSEMQRIMTVETERRFVRTTRGREELKQLGAELAASVHQNHPKTDTRTVEGDKPWLKSLKAFHAEHLKADTIALLADGDQMGLVWQSLIKPINQATWDEANRFKGVKAALAKLFGWYSHEELIDMRQKRVYVESIGESITRENALCALLNCGNASNLTRLLQGHNWTREQLQDVLALCTEKDWELAQSIWDYLETFREESFELEERLTGVKPKAIQAQEIRSPSGKIYRGGYYPVKYNSSKASRGVSPEDRMQGGGAAFPVVEHGSMKDRVGNGLNAPLDLRLDVLTRHLADTVHNLAFREAVINVGRILRQGDFKKALMETAGPEQYKALQSWLQDVASMQNQNMGALGRAASWTRERMAMYTMGLKVSTMVMQLTGGLASCVEIGPKWMMLGTAKVFGHGPKGIVRAYEEAMKMSPMMQNRLTSFEREVATATKKLMDFGSSNKVLDPLKRLDAWVRDHAYIPMGYMQLSVDLPTWWGAFEKAMAENGGNPQAAAEYADHTVEVTQVGGATKDLAGIQRHGEVMKLFTMFYSYFSCLYNLSARTLTMAARNGVLSQAARLAGLSMLWFAEPIISALFVNRGPDDDEDWYAWAAKEALTNPFSMIVGVRDIANFEKSILEGKNYGYRISPAVQLIETLGRAGAMPVQIALGDKELDKKSMKTMAQGVGMALGSPLFGSQAITSLFNMWDWLDGTKEPELRDLIFAQRK